MLRLRGRSILRGMLAGRACRGTSPNEAIRLTERKESDWRVVDTYIQL
jgi:hypothetical protein